jgi:hypothetical protein
VPSQTETANSYPESHPDKAKREGFGWNKAGLGGV